MGPGMVWVKALEMARPTTHEMVPRMAPLAHPQTPPTTKVRMMRVIWMGKTRLGTQKW